MEAEQAGEHGRGFTVVASEVRKLAEGSQAAAEIGALSTDTVKAAREAGDKPGRLVPDIERTAALVDGRTAMCSMRTCRSFTCRARKAISSRRTGRGA